MVKARLSLLHSRYFYQHTVAYPGTFSEIQQIQLKIEERENVDLGEVAQYSGIL
jgi:hypothetical protein